MAFRRRNVTPNDRRYSHVSRPARPCTAHIATLHPCAFTAPNAAPPVSTSHRAVSTRPCQHAHASAVVPSAVLVSTFTPRAWTRYSIICTWPLRAAQCSAVRPAYARRPTCDVVAGSTPVSSTKNLTAARCPAPADHSSAPLPCLSTAAFASHPSSTTSRRSVSTSPRRAASSPGSARASTFPDAMSASNALAPPARPAARSSALRTLLPVSPVDDAPSLMLAFDVEGS